MANKVLIIGATSGLGRGVAETFAQSGAQVGIMGRRGELLVEIAAKYPENIEFETVDVTQSDFSEKLQKLIERMQGVDMILYSSGIGKTNFEMEWEIEENTNKTNVMGFTQCAVFAYRYFKDQGHGHFAVISSVAGFRGLRGAPSYSASKGYERIFVESLAQTAHKMKVPIRFSTIIPGFVDTDLIKDSTYPMTLSLPKAVCIIYKGLKKQNRYIYVDGKYRILSFFMRLIPNYIWERIL